MSPNQRDHDLLSLGPLDEYVLAERVEEEASEAAADYTVAPPTGPSKDEIEGLLVDPALIEQARHGFPIEPPRSQSFQFSMLELLTIVTFAAVGLAGARWLPSGTFAGLAGAFAVLSFVILKVVKPEDSIVRLAWLALTTMYVLAAVATLILSWGEY